MTKSLTDFLKDRPVDRSAVEAHKTRMMTEIHAFQLRELRKAAGLTQAQLAERIGVSQRQVPKIEHGDLNNSRLGTLRSYIDALGGELEVGYVAGDTRILIG